MTFEIPIWTLQAVGALVVLVPIIFICDRQLSLLNKNTISKRKERVRQKEKERVEKDRHMAELEIKEYNENLQKECLLDRLLPGPWRKLYDFLHGSKKATKQSVILSASTFKRDFGDNKIPLICPRGFDIILKTAYYNIGGNGNCHEQFTLMLQEYVKFPAEYFPEYDNDIWNEFMESQ